MTRYPAGVIGQRTYQGTYSKALAQIVNHQHRIPFGSVAKFRHGRRTSATLPYPRASGRLGFESLADDCDGLRERTGTDTECALDDARLAANVLREVEDRRLALA